MTETLVTEYGNVTLNRDGYFRINTGKNAGKLLHRVIFEDFYQKTQKNTSTSIGGG